MITKAASQRCAWWPPSVASARRATRSGVLQIQVRGAYAHPIPLFECPAAMIVVAMVNVDFSSPALLLGTGLIVVSVTLLQLRSTQYKLANDADIVVAAMLSVVGGTLMFQGWRLDPLLLLCQVLEVAVGFYYLLETLRMRAREADADAARDLERKGQQLPLPYDMQPPPAAGAQSAQQQQQQYYGALPPAKSSQDGNSWLVKFLSRLGDKQQPTPADTTYLPPPQQPLYPFAPGQQRQQQYDAAWGPQTSSSQQQQQPYGSGLYDEPPATIRYDYYGNPLPSSALDQTDYGVYAEQGRSSDVAVSGQALRAPYEAPGSQGGSYAGGYERVDGSSGGYAAGPSYSPPESWRQQQAPQQQPGGSWRLYGDPVGLSTTPQQLRQWTQQPQQQQLLRPDSGTSTDGSLATLGSNRSNSQAGLSGVYDGAIAAARALPGPPLEVGKGNLQQVGQEGSEGGVAGGVGQPGRVRLDVFEKVDDWE